MRKRKQRESAESKVFRNAMSDPEFQILFASGNPPPVLTTALPRWKCRVCEGAEFIFWTHEDDPLNQAVTCNNCGDVYSSTKPLSPFDRPRRATTP